MNILVTGGAGYIGSNTILEIIEKTNWNVISVDNFVKSSPKTFERIHKITGKNIKNYDVDLTNRKETEKIFAENKIDGIIHFAALKEVNVSVIDPFLYYNNNINSLLNILYYQRQYNVKQLIFSSSCSVYGNSSHLPVSETTPLEKAESPYAYSKLIGERILEDFSRPNKDLNFIALRYFNPVGAHKSGLNGELPIATPNNLLPFIAQTAIGIREKITIFGGDYNTPDGTCIRDYIHVSDIAFAHVLALQYLFQNKQKTNFDIFNIGTGYGISVLEIVKAFEIANNLNLNYSIGPRREGDVEKIYADFTKANTLLGWKPTHSLNEMVISAWEWEKNLQKNE
jgi:UDP-glucose 4-epimerase